MVGGRNRKLGDLNLATQGLRQPGSAFKPFVLAAALEHGKTLSDGYAGPSSITVTVNGIRWHLSNYDHAGYGWLSLRSATAYSVNTVYAQLVRDVGPAAVVDVAKRLGITTPIAPNPSLALGTSNVTPLQLASAYTAFAGDGMWVPPTGLDVVHAGDRVLFQGPQPERRVLPADIAGGVQQALAAVTSYGTGSRVRIPGFATFGKTGTTEEHSDAWFVGWAGPYVTAVWVGYPNSNRPMNDVHGIKVTGNSFPATIWLETMRAALQHEKPPSKSSTTGGSGAASATPGEPAPNGSSEPSTSPSGEPAPTPSRKPFVVPIPSIRPHP